jgi:hypothetical protein
VLARLALAELLAHDVACALEVLTAQLTAGGAVEGQRGGVVDAAADAAAVANAPSPGRSRVIASVRRRAASPGWMVLLRIAV